MLATRTIRKKTKRRTDVTLTDNDIFDVDTISPHDTDALRAIAEQLGTHDRIPNLIRGAARSRDLCDVHDCAARESLRAARCARESGDTVSYRVSLKTAKDARRRVKECRQFARECEDRANALIMAGSASREDGSSSHEATTPDATSGLPPKSVER